MILETLGIIAPYSYPLSTAFERVAMPIFVDVGKTIFYASVMYGCYFIIRKQATEGADRIKWAAIGYIILRCMGMFVRIVDKMAEEMSKIPM